MTLTEFMMAWDIKFPEQKKEREKEAFKKKDIQDLVSLQDRLDKMTAQKQSGQSICYGATGKSSR